MLRGKVHHQCAVVQEDAIRQHQERIGPLLENVGEPVFELFGGPDRHGLQIDMQHLGGIACML
jgi:hypothetical protein